jgi:hypothetical protein
MQPSSGSGESRAERANVTDLIVAKNRVVQGARIARSQQANGFEQHIVAVFRRFKERRDTGEALTPGLNEIFIRPILIHTQHRLGYAQCRFHGSEKLICQCISYTGLLGRRVVLRISGPKQSW